MVTVTLPNQANGSFRRKQTETKLTALTACEWPLIRPRYVLLSLAGVVIDFLIIIFNLSANPLIIALITAMVVLAGPLIIFTHCCKHIGFLGSPWHLWEVLLPMTSFPQFLALFLPSLLLQ